MLFNNGAMFNESRTHRQCLWRIWGDPPFLYVIGMNPSTADESENDPTVTRCEKRAGKMGYGGLIMLNVQDVVETDSKKLDQMESGHRCTPANVAELQYAVNAASRRDADILCAWGKPGQKYGPVAWLTTRASRAGVTLFCLKKNKDGSPAHPLYQPYEKQFEWFGGVNKRDAASPLPTQKEKESTT